ncbi:MAG: GNAT family N-acetyltransferase [Planctomycetota bacterium]
MEISKPENLSSAQSPVFEVVEFTRLRKDEWNRYVVRHPEGTIFHTYEMQQVYEETPSNSPIALACIDRNRDIVAILCAVRVETITGFASRFASRSIFYAEPICDPTEAGKTGLRLLIQQHDEENKGRILFSEIRSIYDTGIQHEPLVSEKYQHLDYLNYLVDLDVPPEQLWNRVSKNTRKQIRKCRNRDVMIEIANHHDAIQKMYQVVQFSYQRSGVPLVDVHLFHHALDILGEGVAEIRFARHQNEIVATGISLKFKELIYAWYGGSYRISGLAPFAFLTWDEIEAGSRQGFKTYDFGGAGWPDEPYGPRDFKSKFGSRLVQFGRYRKIDSKWKMHLANFVYSTKRKLAANHHSKNESKKNTKLN